MRFYGNVNSLYRTSCSAFLSILWNKPSTIKLVKYVFFGDNPEDQFGDVKKHLCSTIERNSDLPQEVKVRLKNFIQPMGKQIMNFYEITRSIFFTYSNPSALSLFFVWSDKGVLKMKETAKEIISCNPDYFMLNLSLAWKFCIQEIVENLEAIFLLMYEDCDKTLFLIGNGVTCFWYNSSYNRSLFRTSISDEIRKISCDEVVYNYFENFHNLPVVTYFCERMETELKQNVIYKMLMRIAGESNSGEGLVLKYFLNRCCEPSATFFARENAYKVLVCFLEWPCVDIFLPTVKELWNYLSDEQYECLIIGMAEYIEEYDMTLDYQNVFYEFWEASPSSFKNYVYMKFVSDKLLVRLMHKENTDGMVKFILNSMSPNERQQVILYNFENMKLVDCLLTKERFVSLKTLILGCIPNTEVFNKFLVQYANQLKQLETSQLISSYVKYEIRGMKCRIYDFLKIARVWFKIPQGY